MSFIIQRSSIHGLGIFTTKHYAANDFIFVAINSNKIITDLGLKINHSWSPNTHLLYVGGEWNIYAIDDIGPYTELTTNYNNNKPVFIKPANPYW